MYRFNINLNEHPNLSGENGIICLISRHKLDSIYFCFVFDKRRQAAIQRLLPEGFDDGGNAIGPVLEETVLLSGCHFAFEFCVVVALACDRAGATLVSN